MIKFLRNIFHVHDYFHSQVNNILYTRKYCNVCGKLNPDYNDKKHSILD